MRLLCVGDSNTYGYDPRSFFGSRYPSEVRWTDQLARSTGWKIVNYGINGQSIPTGVISLPEADGLVVMLGSNDLLNGCSAAEVATRMERFLRLLLSRYPHILLIAPPPMKYGDWVAGEQLLSQSVLLTSHYEALAEKLGISFADSGSWNVELSFDGVHFSEAGHDAFYNGIRQALISLIES